MSMRSAHHLIELDTQPGFALHDITTEVQQLVADSGIHEGILVASSLHTTCALTINEHESRLLDDIRLNFWRLMPPEGRYLHNDLHLRQCPADEPRNAHAHLIAMLLGNSETLPIHQGNLEMGRWQSLLLVELDGPRSRQVAVQIMGTGAM